MLSGSTLKVGRQPTGFAKLAWNVLKFTNIYAARKKFDISGAIAFSSPIRMNLWKQEANGMSFRRENSKTSRKTHAMEMMNVNT